MDRKLYKLPIVNSSIPAWVCPTCRKGVLELVEGSFKKEERAQSRQMRQEDYWEIEWIQNSYICLLQCGNRHCKEIVTSCGEGGVEEGLEETPEGDCEQVYTEYFQPKFFLPHLKLINVPEDSPLEVRTEINKSFELFFCDAASASNHLRVALELLLTFLKVKRFITKAKKRRYLKLHDRIDLIPAKQAKLKDMFFAIKWLGNAGSHSSKTITKDDIMDAYEIFDVLLRELFDGSGKLAKKLARQINLKKGPIRKKI